MTQATETRSLQRRSDYDESIMAALLDALCSPQLYDVIMRGSDLIIRPRPHMHPQKAG
jgi:hypothetical protein